MHLSQALNNRSEENMAEERRFYTWRRCSTCRDAKKALDANGVDVQERDFFDDLLNREELKDLASIAGIDNLFSWRSPSAKPYRERRETITEDELIDLMLQEPRLIRRPIVVVPGAAPIIGFNPDKYASLTE